MYGDVLAFAPDFNHLMRAMREIVDVSNPPKRIIIEYASVGPKGFSIIEGER